MKEHTVFAEMVAACAARGLSLAAAESCTGGWFAKSVVDVAGASRVFLGGVVAYQNSVKEQVLGVPGDILARYTAVSAPVACEMARGVKQLTGADIGISVTGLAGPGGGTAELPVGRVFIGIAYREEPVRCLTLTLSGSREEIRATAMLRMAQEILHSIV